MPKNSLRKFYRLFLVLFAWGALSSCEATYPAKTITTQLAKLIKEEVKINATCHLSGKTLWIYLPINNLVNEDKITWDTKGLETMSKALSIVHRVILSTDAKLNFVALIGADVKKYGVELVAIEYIADVRQAIMERFSRGEFFNRSIRDVGYNPEIVGDMTGKSKEFYDIPFDKFLSLQIIHRTKTLFSKDKTLDKLFEIKSTSHAEKFGIIKIDFEFLKKKYDITPREQKIDPLDYVRMITALVVANYDYKDFQAIEIRDTFASETQKLTYKDLKKIKIKLPEFLE